MFFTRRHNHCFGIEEILNFFEMIFRHVFVCDDDAILQASHVGSVTYDDIILSHRGEMVSAEFDLYFVRILFGGFAIHMMLKREGCIMFFTFFEQNREFVFQITCQQRTFATIVMQTIQQRG